MITIPRISTLNMENIKLFMVLYLERKLAVIFQKKGERIIKEWAREYRKELLKNWELIKAEGIYNKIEGADK